MKKSDKLFDFTLFVRVFGHSRPYLRFFVLVFMLALLVSALGIGRPILIQRAVDANISQQSLEGFLPYISMMVVLLMCEVLCQYLFIYYSSWLGQHIVKDIRVKLFRHILKFKMKYFDTSSVGALITRTVTDMERIADIFGQGLFMIFKDLLVMLVVVGAMLYINFRLSLIVLLLLPVILYATRVFQKKMKRAFEQVRTEISNLNSFVQERITGMKVLQLFVREKPEFKHFSKINERHKIGWLKTVFYNSIFFPIAELSSSVTIGLIVWYGGLRVVVDAPVSAGDLFAFIAMVPMLYVPLRHIADKFSTLQMGMVAASRVFAVLDTKSNIVDSGRHTRRNFLGRISFHRVSFSYVSGEEVLKDFSLEIKAGEMVAIVGATGAGKSTVVNLLNRFYEFDKGRITIDGMDVKDVKLATLRKRIAVVQQDVFLFADTILNNITLRNDKLTLEKIQKAAKEIGVHEFIMNLPKDYHYNVKERGVMLSSGQRQLISFLRAYVNDPNVLVLDEATSSVDSHTERLVQRATETITKNRTSIVIAHRLATIKKADKIVVLKKGKIVEQGKHEDLLKIDNGHYRRLYEVQFLRRLWIRR